MDDSELRPEVWVVASHDETIEAMMLLSVLPAREARDPHVNKAAYYLALEGVSAFALKGAVKSILQGSLGHGFFPSPPELRIQCKKVMEPFEWEMERRRRQRQRDSERPPTVIHSEAEKASVARIYASFLASCSPNSQGKSEVEAQQIQARYGITAEALADLPDAPHSSEVHVPKPSIIKSKRGKPRTRH